MKTILVIGGTGTLGQKLIPNYLLKDDRVARVRVLSRNDHTQARLRRAWECDRVDFLMGDVRDFRRVLRASANCQEVYHLAATKRVESAEYDPDEAVKTNVVGTTNVIEACRRNAVVKALYISTDKAVSPINTYGMSKAIAERLWVAGNIGAHVTAFSAIRYGNVLASQGSVLETWEQQYKENKPITVTEGRMTRFFWSAEEAAQAANEAMEGMSGGEVFIPQMKACRLEDLADAFMIAKENGQMNIQKIPERPCEKRHERLFNEYEEVRRSGRWFVKYPESDLFPVMKTGTRCFEGTQYNSDTSEQFTRKELVDLCKSTLS